MNKAKALKYDVLGSPKIFALEKKNSVSWALYFFIVVGVGIAGIKESAGGHWKGIGGQGRTSARFRSW
jgi:hypothetical protein